MKNGKTWIIVALVIAVGVLIYLLSGIRNAASDRDKQITFLQGEVKTYKTAAGNWLSELKGQELAYDEVYAELVAVKKELEKKGVKTTDLKSVGKIRLYVHDTVRLVIDSVAHDTTHIGFEYHDDWADIKLTQAIWWWDLEYTVRDSVYFIINETNPLLRKPVISLQAVANNPNVKITGLEYFEIHPKDKRFGVGPQFGIGFNGTGFSPYIGVGVQYNVIKF